MGKAAGHLSPRCGCPGRLAGQPDPVTDRDQRGDNCVTPLRLAKENTIDIRINSKDLKKREKTTGPRRLTCAGSPWHQTLTSNSTVQPSEGAALMVCPSWSTPGGHLPDRPLPSPRECVLA